MAGLFVFFPLLLISLLFVKPLNKPSVMRFRGLANLLGGILPLASLFLPYLFLGDYPWYPNRESMRYCFYTKPDAPAPPAPKKLRQTARAK